MSDQHNSISPSQVLVPVALVAFVLFLTLAFQTMQVMRDRDMLHQVITQQDKPVEDSHKVQAQLTALALGTKKLADSGDKGAVAIIARMQQMGINIGDQPPGGAAPAAPPAPAPQP